MPVEKQHDAKLVGGVWLPDTETHFVDMLTSSKRDMPYRDGVATYQIRKLDWAMRIVPPDRRRLAVDIGAHVGLWAMWLTKLFGHVEAFEPVPLHAQLFELNVKGSYTLHRVALGQTAGVLDIEVPYEQTGQAHAALGRPHPGAKYVTKPDWWYTVRDIPMVPLDSFDFQNVDFVKIDVEGYELPILKGARETLLKWKPIIVVEQKGNEEPYGEERNAGGLYLQSLGFACVKDYGGDWIMRWQG